MPRTVEEGFRDFLTKLTPLDSETVAAKRHRASIESCLKNEFVIDRFFRSGSFGNGTSIAGYSDVDYFACFPANQLNSNSIYTLHKIRRILQRRFLLTSVKVRNPAVLVPFRNHNESTDIVPACYWGTKGKYNIYEIPDRNGKWLKTCPDGHIKYVSNIDAQLSNKLKNFIRFIKAWKYFNRVPISSFYLELRIAKFLQNVSYIDYNLDISRFFSWLYENRLPYVQDPLGVSGNIYPTESSKQLLGVLMKVRFARNKSRMAVLAESRDNIRNTFSWLRKLFGIRFPTYYKSN